MHRQLVLASTSPYRRVLLERLGLPFTCEAPLVDEASYKTQGLAHRAVAETLALEKARSVQSRFPDAVIVGGDQLVSFDDQILGKPLTQTNAIAQLLAFSGRTHALITSVAVLNRDELHLHTDIAELRMRALQRDEIERYVAADVPLDCAGSYKLEARGITLFEVITSEDHSAITGIPLIALTTILRRIGFSCP